MGRRQNAWQVGTAARAGIFAAAVVAVMSQMPLGALGGELSASGGWQAGEESGSWAATFVVAGSDVNGDFTIEDFPGGAPGGSLSGTLVGTSLQFGVLSRTRSGEQNPTMATFTAAVDGPSISGTFATPEGVTGTWTGSLGSD